MYKPVYIAFDESFTVQLLCTGRLCFMMLSISLLNLEIFFLLYRYLMNLNS
jgi:hypothetical protein